MHFIRVLFAEASAATRQTACISNHPSLILLKTLGDVLNCPRKFVIALSLKTLQPEKQTIQSLELKTP